MAGAREPEDLPALRARMDALNARLVALLQERAALVAVIARHKRQAGLPAADPAREAAMLEALLREPGPGFARDELAALLRAVFAASRGLCEREHRRS